MHYLHLCYLKAVYKRKRNLNMNSLRKLFPVLLVALLLSVCSGCVSSRRMMRVSPLARSGESFSKPDAEASRINTWPVFYKLGDRISALWPMIDVDKQGWAVRPFFNVDGDEY